MGRSKLIAPVFLALLLALSQPAVPAAPQTGCTPSPVYGGVCYETLPKLSCCSAAYLGWSQILVGDRFPLTGRVEGRTGQLPLTFPSGKVVPIALSADGSFSQFVTFDEEGTYRLGDTQPFRVAYQSRLLAGETEETLFGRTIAGYQVAAVPVGEQAKIAVRFSDSAGNPVKNQSLKLGRLAAITTDGDGRAEISYEAAGALGGYDLEPLYPGLAVLSYRTLAVDTAGRLTGLPGGELKGVNQNGQWYFPLRDFLKQAQPDRFQSPDSPWLKWNGAARAAQIGQVTLQVDTGSVMNEHQDVLFRLAVSTDSGRTLLSLEALARLYNEALGWAAYGADGRVRLADPQVP